MTSVQDPGSGVFFTPGSGIKNQHLRDLDPGRTPGSYFRERRINFLGKKYLISLMLIRDGKNLDPGSEMELIRIRDLRTIFNT